MNKENIIDQLKQELDKRKIRIPLNPLLLGPRAEDTVLSKTRKNAYHSSSLLQHDGLSFIQHSHWHILNRLPREEELAFYFFCLNKNKLSKVQVLKILQNSPECFRLENTIVWDNPIDENIAPPVHNSIEYTLDDFLPWDGKLFIKNAFFCILKRSPTNTESAFYLSLLKNNKASKTKIIYGIRHSPEGKTHNVVIKRLLFYRIYNITYKIPVLGHGLMLWTFIFNFKNNIKHFFTQFEIKITAFLNEQFVEGYVNHSQQFNHVIESVEDFSNRVIHSLNYHVHRLELQIQKTPEQEPYHQDIQQNEPTTIDQQNKLTDLADLVSKIDQLSNQVETLKLNKKDHASTLTNLDKFYLDFENRFRGTEEEIKDRLTVYLPYIHKANAGLHDRPILDIGTGRGEWLQLLKSHNLTSYGIDLNQTLVQYCIDKGLDAKPCDAINHLKGLGNCSLGAITGFHIAEHLPFETLLSLLSEAHRVLKPGGILILETPNPTNILMAACYFYTDPTHQRPLVPEMLKYVADYQGFVNSLILPLHKYSDMYKVKSTDPFINQWFYSELDYGYIGYKN